MERLGRSYSWGRCVVPVHVLPSWGSCLTIAECLFAEPGRPGCPTGAAAPYGRRGKAGPQEWPKLPHLERGRQALSEETVTGQAPRTAWVEETAALTVRVKEELLAALRRAAESTTARAVLVLGSDKAFCVGQDLAEHAAVLEESPDRALVTVREHYNPIVRAFEDIQVPVVIGIGGACVGAGLGFALAGDVRVAARRAKFGTSFTGIGLASDSGLAHRLVQSLGSA